jgi:hypothetical protein
MPTSPTSTTGTTAGTTSTTDAPIAEELQQARVEIRRLTRDLAALKEQQSVSEAELDRYRLVLERSKSILCRDGLGTPPPNLGPELIEWLREEYDGTGDIPDDLTTTIHPALESTGWWLFLGVFSERFEPGIFVRTPDGSFAVAWGGLGDEWTIRTWIAMNSPDMPIDLPLCIDVSNFDETAG